MNHLITTTRRLHHCLCKLNVKVPTKQPWAGD